MNLRGLTLRPSRPLPGPMAGLIGRELLAAAPLLIGLFIFQALVPFLPMLFSRMMGGTVDMPDAGDFIGSLAAFFVIVAFLLGVLCGAEEEENGTAGFVRQLPVAPLRVFIEKVMGALLALGLWYLACVAFDAALCILFSPPGELGSANLIFAGKGVSPWAALFFSMGLAAGVWLKKVIPAALVGGGLTMLAGGLALILGGTGVLRSSLMEQTMAYTFVAAMCGIALLAAAWRFTHPEGLIPPGEKPLGLRWKDWQTRRNLTAGLCVMIAAGPWIGSFMLGELFGVNTPRFNMAWGLAGGLALACVIQAALLWTREEDEPARGFLYTLPISRGRILREKLRGLAGRVGLMTLVALVIGGVLLARADFPRPGHNTRDMELDSALMMGVMTLAALPALSLFIAVLALHCRAVIVTVALGSLFIPTGAVLLGDFMIRTSGGSIDSLGPSAAWDGMLWLWCGRLLALAVALGAWLFWLYGQSAIHERGTTARLFGTLLFAAAVFEGAVLFLLVDYRELFFILFGI